MNNDFFYASENRHQAKNKDFLNMLPGLKRPFMDLSFGVADVSLRYNLYSQMLADLFCFLCYQSLFAYSLKWVVLVANHCCEYKVLRTNRLRKSRMLEGSPPVRLP